MFALARATKMYFKGCNCKQKFLKLLYSWTTHKCRVKNWTCLCIGFWERLYRAVGLHEPASSHSKRPKLSLSFVTFVYPDNFLSPLSFLSFSPRVSPLFRESSPHLPVHEPPGSPWQQQFTLWTAPLLWLSERWVRFHFFCQSTVNKLWKSIGLHFFLS